MDHNEPLLNLLVEQDLSQGLEIKSLSIDLQKALTWPNITMINRVDRIIFNYESWISKLMMLSMLEVDPFSH